MRRIERIARWIHAVIISNYEAVVFFQMTIDVKREGKKRGRERKGQKTGKKIQQKTHSLKNLARSLLDVKNILFNAFATDSMTCMIDPCDRHSHGLAAAGVTSSHYERLALTLNLSMMSKEVRKLDRDFVIVRSGSMTF